MDRAMISFDFSHTFASASDYFVFFFDFIHFSYISCRYSAVLTPLSQLWQHGRFSYGQGEFSTCKSRMTDAQEKLCRISECGYKECNYKLINKAAQHKTQGLHEQPRHRLPSLIVSLLSETGLIDTLQIWREKEEFQTYFVSTIMDAYSFHSSEKGAIP